MRRWRVLIFTRQADEESAAGEGDATDLAMAVRQRGGTSTQVLEQNGSTASEVQSPTSTTIKQLLRTPRLLDWSELSSSQQDGNSYIQSGYRPPAASIRDCYRTWSYLHNETVNIFSHVLGSALFFLLPFIVFSQQIPQRWSYATNGDKVVCSIYFAGVGICFALSTVFHTLLCHRERRVADWGMQLDFQGVLLLMWGATVPLIYYGFVCDPTLRWIYWSVQTALAMAASAFTLQPNFKDPSLKALRALTFGGFALSSLVPVVHAVAKYGWSVQVQRMGLAWVFATLGFNATGAAAYALKFPEARWPRRFDLAGCSHNILHVAVVAAGLTHMVGILRAFDFLHGQGDSCL